MKKNYFMVRAMNSTETDFNIFTKKNIVAIGWSNVDFTKYNNNFVKLKEELISHYFSNGNIVNQVIGRQINQIYRFCSIKSGDLIIVPYLNKILLATAIGESVYDKSYKDIDLANQQKVIYQKMASGGLKVIARNLLSEALQRRLRVRGSIVSDLWEFENEIESLFAKETYSYQEEFLKQEQRLMEKSKKILLNNIRTGKTNLQTGGLGLEYLVKELFECEGYKANVCSKRRFPGWADADVEATMDDRFIGTQKLLVQVKHHQGVSGSYGIKQLIEIQKIVDYDDYKMVFITTGEIEKDVLMMAKQSDILLIDGNALVDWIFENIYKLNAETKLKLRVSLLPRVE